MMDSPFSILHSSGFCYNMGNNSSDTGAVKCVPTLFLHTASDGLKHINPYFVLQWNLMTHPYVDPTQGIQMQKTIHKQTPYKGQLLFKNHSRWVPH